MFKKSEFRSNILTGTILKSIFHKMRNTYKALIIFMIVLLSLYILAVVIQNRQHTNGTVAVILTVVLLTFIYKKLRSK